MTLSDELFVLQKPFEHLRWDRLRVKSGGQKVGEFSANTVTFWPWKVETIAELFRLVVNDKLEFGDLPIVLGRISPTDVCNLRCQNCHSATTRSDTLGIASMDKDLYKRSVEEAVNSLGMRYLRINGGGDPTLASYISDLIPWIVNEIGIPVSMNTNGVNIQRVGIDLMASLLGNIWISHKAGDQDGYRAVCGGNSDQYDRLVANATALGKALRKYGRGEEVLYQVSVFVRPETLRSLADFARRAKEEYGANYFQLEPHRPGFKEVLRSDELRAQLVDALDNINCLHDDRFYSNSYTIPTVYSKRGRPRITPKRCLVPYLYLWVAADGRVTPCHEMFNRQRDQILFGRVSHDVSITDIWMSESRRRFNDVYPPLEQPQCHSPDRGIYCCSPILNQVLNTMFDYLVQYPDATFQRIWR